MKIPNLLFEGVNAEDAGIVCHSLGDYILCWKWRKEKKERESLAL